MENWIISSPESKARIVLACITCENVVLLTTKDEILREMRQALSLFLPTVCLSCKKDGEMIYGKTTMWISLSISYNIIRMWQPFLAMKAFLGGELSMSPTAVNLVQHDEVRDMVRSNYVVQSMLLDDKTGRAEVHPYLHTGFF
jgi:hypothetical protein